MAKSLLDKAKLKAERLQKTATCLLKKIYWGYFPPGGPRGIMPVKRIMNSTKYIKIIKTRILPFM